MDLFCIQSPIQGDTYPIIEARKSRWNSINASNAFFARSYKKRRGLVNSSPETNLFCQSSKKLALGITREFQQIDRGLESKLEPTV